MRLPHFCSRYFGHAIFTSIIISIFFAILFRSRSYDDPFITYRYAENLRLGAGFVYNPGERVQSTTTPLFTLLLTVLSPVWGDLPHLANLIGAMSLAIGGLLLWELATLWKSPWVGWSGLLLFPTFALAITTLGSETPLYIAFCVGAYVAYVRKCYRLTAVIAALAALTRPDGLLVGMILATDFTIRHFRKKGQAPKSPFSPSPTADNSLNHPRISTAIPLDAILIFLGILLPWFIFAWAYFGSPLPATLTVKHNQATMAVSQGFTRGFITTLGWYKSWKYIVEAVLSLIGVIILFMRAKQWMLFLTWPVFYFIAFSILGVSRYFWYYTPLVPGFLILTGLGIQAIAELRLNRLLRWKDLPHITIGQDSSFSIQPAHILSILILTVLFFSQVGGLLRLRQPDNRYAIYRAAGDWLASHTAIDATVGALEVGILGYYAKRPMIDFAGLIKPDVAAQLTGSYGYESAALWAVDHFQPHYLALFPGDFPSIEQGYATQHCHLVETFMGSKYGYEKDLVIFDCR